MKGIAVTIRDDVAMREFIRNDAADTGDLHIGGVKLDNPFLLAPLAGITDAPMRGICKACQPRRCDLSVPLPLHGVFLPYFH